MAKLEVEAKRHDGSWHPCRISLSSDAAALGIVLSFENGEEVETISTREDALARLRIRSTSIQGGECSQIKEGDCVLAMHKGKARSLFFDAVVEMVNRVKHSKRVHCRCTFALKWLAPQLKDERITVPSQSIMKLSDMDIQIHPVFVEFRTACCPNADAELFSISSLFEKTPTEAEFDGLLEKQVEEISKYAAEMEWLEDGISGVKEDDQDGYRQSTMNITSGLVLSKTLTDLKKFTNGKSKQLELEGKEHTDDPPLLSPLAARAALASLIHELPKEAAFPIYQIDKEFPLTPPHCNTTEQSSGANCPTQFHSFLDKNVLKAPTPCENSSDVSGRRAALKTSHSEKSSNIHNLQEKSVTASRQLDNRKLSNRSILNTSTNSVVDVNLSGLTVTRRVTRSAAREEVPCVEQQKATSIISGIVSPSSTSTSQKEMNEGNNKKELGRINSNHDNSSDIFNVKEEPVAASRELDNRMLHSQSVPKHSINSMVDCSNLSSLSVSRRLTRSAAKREMSSLCVEHELDTSSIPTSLCISTDQNTRTEGNTEKGFKPINSIDHTKDLVTPQKNKKSSDISNLQEKLLLHSKDRHKRKLSNDSLLSHRTSAVDGNLSGLVARRRVTRSAAQREMLKVEQQQAPDGVTNSPVSSNAAASADHRKARNEGKAKKDFGPVNFKQELEDLVAPKEDENKKNVSVSLSTETSANLMPGTKRTRASCGIARAQKNGGQDAERRSAKKNRVAASEKLVLRSSPRLRFVPRTRSQVEKKTME